MYIPLIPPPIPSVASSRWQARQSESGTAPHRARRRGRTTQAGRDPPLTVVQSIAAAAAAASEASRRAAAGGGGYGGMWYPWPAAAAQRPASEPRADSDETTGWERRRGRGTETGA
ncbi:uncharacterized protein CTHT_0029710 [Thermochaetoides thermophila DSM 1495]|uniref:Uncharacterized protein n=1 Tax=Chaetomium thermophilum (strain DSM 1495 / CBS 144.50 / IMI 039719) TaxID=759272 RepID=G0S8F6_CHATD|nr:hypothetical protein CTHT_0029710 [Thermochaetoides thermophila DSM 1495]EGS21130.1 hypothetical protein CTHT_0029710 [Thermochaetoides thermophila DSM 1495]